MKITSFDQLICRTPAFGTGQSLKECWQQLKSKIEQSSPSFFDLIKQLDYAQLGGQNEKIRYTIWKYFNRARYRATPFGSFAAISLMDLSYDNPTLPRITESLHQHHWMDWSEVEANHSNYGTAPARLIANATSYFTSDEIRYIRSANGRFELAAISAAPEISSLLRHCRTSSTTAELYQLLGREFGYDKKTAQRLIAQLGQLQLLWNERQANITGQDYFQRLDIQRRSQPSDYIICQRELSGGCFDGRSLRQLPDWIRFCAAQLPIRQSDELNSFVERFNQRFENQQVSLSRLMDPETGIGYGGLEQQVPGLVDELNGAVSSRGQRQLIYGELQEYLLKKICGRQRIDLAEHQFSAAEKSTLPNTFSVVFHLYHGRPVIEGMGGSTANALLGRFTPVSKQFAEHAIKISETEATSNPGALFFDIAYHGEPQVDNINRRIHLYPQELPLVGWSTHQHPLHIEDILVAVEHGQVILSSKELGKRIVPRIPSAYNHSRSDLSVYRFLCDVQNQGLAIDLGFRLQNHFPALDHYPRVYFRDIIVSPAQWLLPLSASKGVTMLRDWLGDKQIDRRLRVGHSDQQLCIDPKNEDDLWALACYCSKQSGPVYLTEALMAEEDQICDEKGNSYAQQYIASYFHTQQLYPAFPVSDQHPLSLHLPGSAWLYLELYCHCRSADQLLLQTIRPLLSAKKQQIKKWFFIRYTDPSDHIRLRIQLKDLASLPALLDALQATIGPKMQKGSISQYLLKTYARETQRYGIGKMAMVEDFFAQDSSQVLGRLSRSKGHQQLMGSTVMAMLELCQLALADGMQQLTFAKVMMENFAREMDFGPAAYKKLNADFRQFMGKLPKVQYTKSRKFPKRWTGAFLKVINSAESAEVRQQLLSDLIHMHINRIFADRQRLNEAIAYHHLKKLLQSSLSVRQ